MTRRKVVFKDISKGVVEAWAVESPECPIKEALTTLGKEPRACIAGVVTNCQGGVPLNHCEFCDGDKTFREEKDHSYTIDCLWKAKS